MQSAQELSDDLDRFLQDCRSRRGREPAIPRPQVLKRNRALVTTGGNQRGDWRCGSYDAAANWRAGRPPQKPRGTEGSAMGAT